MSTPRTRTRSMTSRSEGTAVFSYEGTPWATFRKEGGTNHQSTCKDLVGERGVAFSVDSYTINGNTMNSSYTSPSGSLYTVSNWDFDELNLWGYGHLYDPDRPPNFQLAVELLRRTNPSKSLIDLPVSLFELRELPDLVKGAVGNLANRYAGKRLQSEFGIAPTMGDVKKLFSFRDKVQKRVKLLKKFENGPLLRKAQLYESSLHQAGWGPNDWASIQQSDFPIEARMLGRTTQIKTWGYVTYTPTAGMDKLLADDQALRNKAMQIIGGLTVDLSNVYQALPWSWLADWFGNLGDYLSAHRNLLPVETGIPRIMDHIVTTTSLEIRAGIAGPDWRHSYNHVWSSKGRTLASAAFPSVSLPFLTARQIEILGSLAITRGKAGRF